MNSSDVPINVMVELTRGQAELFLERANLTERELQVIRLRFGIEHVQAHSLDEVAAQLKVTRERVRQIEARALRKMRGIPSHIDDIIAEYPQWFAHLKLLHAIDVYREKP